MGSSLPYQHEGPSWQLSFFFGCYSLLFLAFRCNISQTLISKSVLLRGHYQDAERFPRFAIPTPNTYVYMHVHGNLHPSEDVDIDTHDTLYAVSIPGSALEHLQIQECFHRHAYKLSCKPQNDPWLHRLSNRCRGLRCYEPQFIFVLSMLSGTSRLPESMFHSSYPWIL